MARAAILRLDPARRAAVASDGQEVKLTSLEFRLLRLLMSRPGYTFQTNEIIQSIWGSGGESDIALLKNVVYRLRKKLGADSGGPYSIQTWSGGTAFRRVSLLSKIRRYSPDRVSLPQSWPFLSV